MSDRERGEIPVLFYTDFIIQVNIQLFSSYIKDSMKLQKARKTVNITTFFLDGGEERTQCTKHSEHAGNYWRSMKKQIQVKIQARDYGSFWERDIVQRMGDIRMFTTLQRLLNGMGKPFLPAEWRNVTVNTRRWFFLNRRRLAGNLCPERLYLSCRIPL